MKVCKIKPNRSTCMACVDTQIANNEIYSCDRCLSNSTYYEILGYVSGLLEVKAILLKDGKLFTVPIARLYDIKEI